MWFGQIRQRNGWSYNPTALQFRYAYRALLLHGGRAILNFNGNCKPQDETVILTLSNKAIEKAHNNGTSAKNVLDETDGTVSEKPIHEGCIILDCIVCRASLAYIAGFYVYSLQKKITCEDCRSALESSDEDPCSDDSLIQLKNFKEGALQVPSASMCKLLYLTEHILRRNLTLVNSNTSNLEDKLVMKVLNELDNNSIFPIISLCHAIDTCEGIDNHYFLLVQLVSRKYLRLRIKNILKDNHHTRSLGNGNALQRNRVTSNSL